MNWSHQACWWTLRVLHGSSHSRSSWGSRWPWCHRTPLRDTLSWCIMASAFVEHLLILHKTKHAMIQILKDWGTNYSFKMFWRFGQAFHETDPVQIVTSWKARTYQNGDLFLIWTEDLAFFRKRAIVLLYHLYLHEECESEWLKFNHNRLLFSL